jgi:hypothetical protein
MEELGLDRGGVAKDLKDCSLEPGHFSILSLEIG